MYQDVLYRNGFLSQDVLYRHGCLCQGFFIDTTLCLSVSLSVSGRFIQKHVSIGHFQEAADYTRTYLQKGLSVLGRVQVSCVRTCSSVLCQDVFKGSVLGRVQVFLLDFSRTVKTSDLVY